jgi:MFS family permease
MSGEERQESADECAAEYGTPERGVFYGWAIVAVLVVFTARGVGLAGANIAVFIEPMTREQGWSRVAFGWAQMARLETVIIAGPVFGRVIDRYGPQVPVAIAGVVIFYPLSQFAIDSIGWRDACLVLGIAGAVVIGPLSLLVLQRQSVDIGMLPDGDAVAAAEDAGARIPVAVEVSWT